MKNLLSILCCFIFIIALASCKNSTDEYKIKVTSSVKHPLAIISVSKEDLPELFDRYFEGNLSVVEKDSDLVITYQWMDDELLLGVSLEAGEVKSISIMPSSDPQSEQKISTFARFVPERTDDFAWENDKVAFRTYGPNARDLVLEGKSGGTLSSGIDAWHKKVDYPIIDKWYDKELNTPGTYHKDDGEGADFYHVGSSRGVGSSGFWAGDTLFAAVNFTDYEILENGPLRTVFRLHYAPYEANDLKIKETKTISIDLGSHFSKYEIEFEEMNGKELPYLTAGITLHEKKGEVFVNPEQGYFAQWEPMSGTEIGTAIVVTSPIEGFLEHVSEHIDQSQLLVNIRKNKNLVSYFAGFAWDQAGEITTRSEWEKSLLEFSERLKNKPKIEILN
ncbi:DUF4861 domain-containing protein [Belliella sp. R4-6]|uniref:DUF4861 domain-containing protein n=1 Tax=Belliella alkalica TaxID=1730871 RepID=A0ABS9VBB0_9BACT|nr:DUF4861 family protein [Belliella alkalica]MCH7413733.1 DUF4861 domain-containing protein [Belliella alkalica]